MYVYDFIIVYIYQAFDGMPDSVYEGVWGLSKTKRVQMILEEDLLKRLDAEAEKLGLNRSEFIRLSVEERLSNNAASEGVDTTARILRKLIQDEMNPQFNRMAKMIAKSTKASATGMYLQVVELNAGGKAIDVVKAFRDSEAQAATYLNNKERE
jgi:metal-responsive CopG/Arc/MetJ family transcriptional regulator